MNNDLFPNLDVKPDINAQSLKDDLIIPEENVKLTVNDQKIMKSQNDIFMSNKKTVEIPKPQMAETSSEFKSEIGESENQKKDRYAHLVKARAKGAETRKAKAEAKRQAKEAEKARKAEERRIRKEATMERNRQKARERYHRQKVIKEEEQKNLDQKFVESIPKPPEVNNSRVKSRLPQRPSGMDFNTFAKYMMKYEQMKDAYQKSQKPPPKTTKKVTIQEKPKSKPYHPKNYPLSHLYGRKKKKQFFE
jgi:hypothetical protein